MLLPEVEFTHTDIFHKDRLSGTMLWPYVDTGKTLADADAALFFIGAMEGEDTEQYDKNSAQLNPVYDYFIRQAMSYGKPVIVVLQTGSAVILGDWYKSVDAIAEMWLGGEAAGSAIADVLTGRVNPCGRLPETFPACERTDLTYDAYARILPYDEKLNVGYRYYDKHPEEIVFPFGHGLSYTSFAYDDASLTQEGDRFTLSFTLRNAGGTDGAEIVQLYAADPVSTVSKPPKALIAFKKVFLAAGEEQRISIPFTARDLAYYNVSLHDWVTEEGVYELLVGASSRDIRLTQRLYYAGDMPYTMTPTGETMLG
jgi:beta-glucosidase